MDCENWTQAGSRKTDGKQTPSLRAVFIYINLIKILSSQQIWIDPFQKKWNQLKSNPAWKQDLTLNNYITFAAPFYFVSK